MNRFVCFALGLFTALSFRACLVTNGPPPTDNDSGSTDDASMMTTDDAAPTDVPVMTTLPDGAPNPCLDAHTCEECAALTPCGWCGDRCLAGTLEASFDGTCSGMQWAARGSQCPGVGAQCPTHTDCTSCAMDENSCGWCASTRHCVAGDNRGPAWPMDGCTLAQGTWIYNTETQMCPAGQ
jgi:hypothetical protein